MNGQQREAEATRRKVKELKALRWSIAKIAKHMDKSYRYIKQLYEQE
jgi:hypothetical protein